jgi:parallel beta-helix repeat protein
MQPANAAGNVTITNCTANDNDDDGMNFYQAGGDLTITNCTAIGNTGDGLDVGQPGGSVTINGCIARENEDGVELDEMPDTVTDGRLFLVNGNILCDNNDAGLSLDAFFDVNAEGNWWGCPAGPGDPGCDGIQEWSTGSVDFRPFINSIRGSATVNPVTVGDPTVVSFQFSNSGRTVFLALGPGDLRGPAPFTLTTDNGTLSDGGFINQPDGVLQVTLTPDTPGTATVTAVGPCGLGETVVLTVLALPVEEFVPEPGSVILFASGLMGLAGYATLRLRKR